MNGHAGFSEFYRDYYRRLLRDVVFGGGDQHEAEDAVHAAMLDTLRRWQSISNPYGYARTAAFHYLIKRKEQVRKELHELDEEEELNNTGQEIWEQKEWVTMVLNSLPPAQREVLACMVDSLKSVEIASLLGKSPDAIRQNLSAARKRLRRELGYGEESR